MLQRFFYILLLVFSVVETFGQINFYAGALEEVALNEQYQVVFVLENAKGQSFTPPNFEGFRVINGPFINKFSSTVNGSYSSTESYKYILQPLKEGAMTIASASVRVGGNTLYTEKIELTVLPPKPQKQQNNQNQVQQAPPPNRQAAKQDNEDWKKQAADKLFVKFYTDNEQPYIGEQVFVYAKLYVGINTNGVQLTEIPEFQGFWKQEIEFSQEEPEMEVYKGRRYNTYLVAKYALFPLKEGKYTIDPVKMKAILTLQVPRTINFGRIQMETYDFEYVEYNFASDALVIDAKPLPLENRPVGFIGAVGQFDLKTTIDSTQVNYGSPIRWKASLSGRGNIMSIQEPELEFPRLFDVYDPEIKENISTKSNYVNGSKSYEYILVPKRPGSYTIPSLGFSYFDPKKEEYITLYSPEYPIEVKGEMPKVEMDEVEENFIEAYELAPVRMENDLSKQNDSFFGSSRFYSGISVPFILYGFFLLAMRWKDNNQVDLVALKNKRALKEAKKRLEKAKINLDAQEKEAFYTEIFDAFNGYVGDKLAINQADLNKEYVVERFREKEISENLAEQFIQVLSNAEAALYSPASVSKMQEDYDIAIQWIVNIEHEIS